MSWRSQRGEMNLSLGGGNGELASGEDSSVPLTRKQCGIRNDLRFLTLRNLGNYTHRIKIESQAICQGETQARINSREKAEKGEIDLPEKSFVLHIHCASSTQS